MAEKEKENTMNQEEITRQKKLVLGAIEHYMETYQKFIDVKTSPFKLSDYELLKNYHEQLEKEIEKK